MYKKLSHSLFTIRLCWYDVQCFYEERVILDVSITSALDLGLSPHNRIRLQNIYVVIVVAVPEMVGVGSVPPCRE